MPFRLLAKMLWSQRGLLLWAGVLALIAWSWAFLKRDVIVAYFENRRQRNEIRREVEEIEAEVRRREREREVLSQGGFESEKVAREVYHMSKPGETILRLYPSPLDEDIPTTPAGTLR